MHKTMRKKIFNLTGDDSISTREMIGGNTTNLINLNNVKYRWATSLYRKMVENFWIPEKVDMSLDANQYGILTEDEKRAYNGVLSFLIFLDSIQVSNLPNITSWITAPEVVQCLTLQTYQEAIHAQSYAYVIETILPSENRDYIYDYWRNDEILKDRNAYIAGVYQNFVDYPNDENFYKVLIANYLLEGLYFYNGFQFFYNLVSRHLMGGTADIIRYIHKDELTHVTLFQKIISEVIPESMHDTAYQMTETAVEQEIKWTNHIIGNRILGITEESTESHTKYLANIRLKAIGLNPLYPASFKNPYQHLELISDTGSEATVKGNFFETTVTSYSQSSAVEGWDF